MRKAFFIFTEVLIILCFSACGLVVPDENVSEPIKSEQEIKAEKDVGKFIPAGTGTELKTKTESKYIYSGYLPYKNYIVYGLKDKELLAQINEFVSDSKDELIKEIDDFAVFAGGYDNISYSVYDEEFTKENRKNFIVNLSCQIRNDYLSIIVCLATPLADGTGLSRIFDCRTATYRISENSKINSISELFYNSFWYTSVIEKYIKENGTSAGSLDSVKINDFNWSKDDFKYFTFDSVILPKDNKYFNTGVVLKYSIEKESSLVDIEKNSSEYLNSDVEFFKEFKTYESKYFSRQSDQFLISSLSDYESDFKSTLQSSVERKIGYTTIEFSNNTSEKFHDLMKVCQVVGKTFGTKDVIKVYPICYADRFVEIIYETKDNKAKLSILFDGQTGEEVTPFELVPKLYRNTARFYKKTGEGIIPVYNYSISEYILVNICLSRYIKYSNNTYEHLIAFDYIGKDGCSYSLFFSRQAFGLI